jgi:hypothetical protein
MTNVNYKELIKKNFPDVAILQVANESDFNSIVYNTSAGVTLPTKNQLDALFQDEELKSTIPSEADPITISGDMSGTGCMNITTTLATVNSNVGIFGSSSRVPVLTVNAKGLITAASTVQPATAGIFYATTNAATTLGSTATAIPFQVEVRKDTELFLHINSSSLVTILYDGWYRVTANINVTVLASSSKFLFQIYHNSVSETGSLLYLGQNVSGSYANGLIELLVNCQANDTIELRGTKTAGSGSTTSGACRMMIEAI